MAQLLEGFHSVYCDASFFIALFSKKDSKHKRAMKIFYEIKEKKIKIYTCWFVISESMTILLYHYGYTEAITFNKSLDLYNIIYPNKAQYYEALAVFNRYIVDKKIPFGDALSQIIISKELNNIPAISFDKDFRGLGLTAIS